MATRRKTVTKRSGGLAYTMSGPRLEDLITVFSPRKSASIYNNAMREIGQLVKDELVKEIKKDFPNSQNLSKVPFFNYNTSRRRLTIGISGAGLVDSDTGRPVAEYMSAVFRPPNGSQRTRPPSTPMVGVRPDGSVWVSKVVTERILPWVRRTIPTTSERHAFFVAVTVAKKIQKQGVKRSDAILRVVNSSRRRGGITSSVEPRLRNNVRRIMDQMKRKLAGKNP